MNTFRKFTSMLIPIISFLRTANCKLRTCFILILPFLLLTLSCEEEFDINAPYQDISVIYGLMDPGEDTVFLKINKAFLGEGNVLEMAKIEDSSMYVNDLDAYIEEWDNGSMIKAYQLDTITINNKEEGTFYNPYQVIYYTLYQPETSHDYKLKVFVNEREITATTRLVNDFTVSKPSAGSSVIQFPKEITTPGEIKWESAKYGKRYEVVIRIKYKEVLFDSPDTVYTYVDWAMGTKKSVTDKGGEVLTIKYSNDGFYNFIGNEIPYSDPVAEANVKERHTNDVDFIFAVAGLELNTYMEVNEPSNSIVQERPEYTNISNGIGLFSSRYKKIRTKKIGLITVQTIKADLPELKFVY
jgi:hypothetical protein